MIPKSKFDLESVRLLGEASDDEIVEVADQILVWLQGVNWSVFEEIVNRLSVLGNKNEAPINKILESDDSIWKANIVGHLIPAFSNDPQQLYTKSLEILLTKYDQSDLEEGVINFVEIQLSNIKKNM